jgi:hypothetical protein
LVRKWRRLCSCVAGASFARELIAATISEALVLRGVDGPRVLDDLARDPLGVQVGLATGDGRDLAAIDRHDVQADQASACAQSQHGAENIGERVRVAQDKASDRAPSAPRSPIPRMVLYVPDGTDLRDSPVDEHNSVEPRNDGHVGSILRTPSSPRRTFRSTSRSAVRAVCSSA